MQEEVVAFPLVVAEDAVRRCGVDQAWGEDEAEGREVMHHSLVPSIHIFAIPSHALPSRHPGSRRIDVVYCAFP